MDGLVAGSALKMVLFVGLGSVGVVERGLLEKLFF
jgi:hypothetical protein